MLTTYDVKKLKIILDFCGFLCYVFTMIKKDNYKKITIEFTFNGKIQRSTATGVKCIETFKTERLSDYGEDARIVSIQHDEESAAWAKAFEQDKRYKYNG